MQLWPLFCFSCLPKVVPFFLICFLIFPIPRFITGCSAAQATAFGGSAQQLVIGEYSGIHACRISCNLDFVPCFFSFFLSVCNLVFTQGVCSCVYLFGYGILVQSPLSFRDDIAAVSFRRPSILMLVALQLILCSVSDQSSFEPYCFVSWTSGDFTPMATMGKMQATFFGHLNMICQLMLKQDL